ncbi:hypothetical protein BDP81DRAFT_496657 [Colletotrichum phormii]|uniref:GAG-pre-integrase domain-containing protein n=1 Tax=Colletotrichum phormii TaxID=359342 RepID=A0AAI9ZM44_9PEZI|nr:uncharacterized protein BDP81DRAFT_496657 [Colletotrichum phormii]KAK1625809.1 hypothetical protein BDP81DRAFT_496657 [Colletotrichum phormii]
MGHPGDKTINHLVNASRGVKLTQEFPNRAISICEACRLGKAKRQVSRLPRESLQWSRIGERIAVDFHTVSPQGYGGITSAVIFSDRITGCSWDYYLHDRTSNTLLKVFTMFLT